MGFRHLTLHPLVVNLEQKIQFLIMAEQKWLPHPSQSKNEVALYSKICVQPYAFLSKGTFLPNIPFYQAIRSLQLVMNTAPLGFTSVEKSIVHVCSRGFISFNNLYVFYHYREYYKQLANYYSHYAHQPCESDDQRSVRSSSRGSTPGPDFSV